jgi:hypothetical protein
MSGLTFTVAVLPTSTVTGVSTELKPFAEASNL